MRLPMFLTALLAPSLLQSASAQDQPMVPPHRWNVDYSHAACTLARRVGDERSAIFALHAPLGMEPGQLVITDGGSGLDLRLSGELELRLDQGAALVVRARREERSGRSIVQLRPFPEDFLARVADARQLAVARNGEAILTLAVPDAREAIDALARCNDDLLQSWGVDVGARRALSQRPAVRDFTWAFEVAPLSDAYVALVANISERGRPIDCRVVVTTGNRRMDQAVCRAFRGRAQLEPALDEQGRPVAAQFVTGVRFTVRE
jgi:Gram-negative bacterial TonB protein C-terminal